MLYYLCWEISESLKDEKHAAAFAVIVQFGAVRIQNITFRLKSQSKKYASRTVPRMMRYQPKTEKSFFLI